MSDSIMGVPKFRTFNVMDDCTWEALAIEIDTSLSSKRIIRILESVIAWRGKPTVIRTDNGPGFTSKDFEWWCKEHNIEIQFIQPRVPRSHSRRLPVHRYPRSPSPNRRMDRRLQRTKTP
jgi:putative transposase